MTQEKKPYDVIIIGAGAAGLSAAIYTTRRALKTLIISQDIGGQTLTTNHIENYPGFETISGPDLMLKFQAQAQKFGAEIITNEVKDIKKQGDKFLVRSIDKQYETASIILAFGLSHRHLELKNEEELIGKGVSYCVTCDAPLYKEKVVAVVGGGSSAIDGTLFLAKISKKVYLIHKRDEFRGEQILVEQIKMTDNIELLLNSKVVAINGKNKLEKITVSDINEKQIKELNLDGLFIEIGYVAKTGWIKNIVKLDEKNQVIIDAFNRTNTEGIFAAGDLTNISYKQIVIAASEGAKAALTCYKYLQNKGLVKRGAFIDWGKK